MAAIRRVLVIAGSDSSGGAGLEADRSVIAAHGCYGMSVTTALTAQNTLGVHGIHHTPPEFVRKMFEACISDIPVDVVKTGMLASVETVQVVADALQEHQIKKIVVDPVMVATSGSQLLPREATRRLREQVLPLATVLTPNVPEALLLLADAGKPADNPKHIRDLINIAKSVQSLGPRYVLVKGGHLPLQGDGSAATNDSEREIVVDILYGGGKLTRIDSKYQKTKNTHGTGCSLASAIASNLANGVDVISAVKRACRYVEAGIKTASDVGQGSGPINHFHSTYTLPFSPGRFVEYLLERPDVQKPWREYTEHSFISGLADGTLPVECFKCYLIQDYLYLVQFARAHALGAYKANSLEDTVAASRIVTHVYHEMGLHIKYCKSFGVTREEIESTEESQACTAYTRYILDIGQSRDWLSLQFALAPCLLGYGAIAQRLYADTQTKKEGNLYWKWIENYVAEDFTDAVRIGSELLERHVVLQSPSSIEELVKIFIQTTKLETGFWIMGVETAAK